MEEPTNDDISADLAALDALRRSVDNNLALRPLRGESGELVPSSRHSLELPNTPGSPGTPASAYFTPIGIHDSFPGESPISRLSPHSPAAMDPETLFGRLLSRRRPLLIDTRAPGSHAAFQILHSINIAIPPPLLKRMLARKEHVMHTIQSLRQFITTDASRASWDNLMRADRDTWDGDVILYDDEPGAAAARSLLPVIEPLLRGAGSVDWLDGGISVASRHPGLQTLVVSGDEAEIASANDPDSELSTPSTGSTPGGRTPFTAPTPHMPGNYNLDDATPSPSPSQAAVRPSVPRKSSLGTLRKLDTTPPLKLRKSTGKFNNGLRLDLSLDEDRTHPPPLSTSLGIVTQGLPKLGDDDDGISAASPGPLKSADAVRAKKSLDRLPKLQIGQSGGGGLMIPPIPKRSRSPSPGRLKLAHSNFSSKRPTGLVLDAGSGSDTSPPPPKTPKASARTHEFDDLPPSPATAKPDGSGFPSSPGPPLPKTGFGAGDGWPGSERSRFGRHHATSSISSNASGSSTHEEEPLPEFLVSMILPGFLYLGPEPSEEEHVEQMKSLGIRRILNMALECNPTDHGLALDEAFEKYIKIPMRDTVEEDRVTQGIKVACDTLDDARLHSAPMYVHCKAGKSRSVTAVIAYLIHANHWTLSRAYSFVLERRKGISPNIGFVSELMNFEERELGGKSGGVQKSAGSQPPETQASHANSTSAHPHRRGGHIRESLPPVFSHAHSSSIADVGPVSAVDAAHLKLLGLGEEMEMRDSGGRYRHARRAPVDEQTLQPMRRVSKAGLESIAFGDGRLA